MNVLFILLSMIIFKCTNKSFAKTSAYKFKGSEIKIALVQMYNFGCIRGAAGQN